MCAMMQTLKVSGHSVQIGKRGMPSPNSLNININTVT